MSKIRYYFELNPNFIDHFGGYQYLTGVCEKPSDGHLPKFGSHGPHRTYQLIANSDRVIAADDTSIRYIKNRHMDLSKAVVDLNEFFEIKMKGVELS
jgi:hypothetical protein